jgi:hypothetical protein
MRSAFFTCAFVSSVVAGLAIAIGAQAPPANDRSKDPRVGLKAGYDDAGEAAHNMERVATMPKAKGFFDPKAPAGLPTPPERNPQEEEKEEAAEKAALARGETPPERQRPGASNLNFANSDLGGRGKLHRSPAPAVRATSPFTAISSSCRWNKPAAASIAAHRASAHR